MVKAERGSALRFPQVVEQPGRWGKGFMRAQRPGWLVTIGHPSVEIVANLSPNYPHIWCGETPNN